MMSDSSRPRETGEQRRDREDENPGEEQAPPAEPVAEPAAEQEEPAEHQRIGADHPLQVLLGEAEVCLDGRERDVDDRDVEDGHELHDADQRQGEPFRLSGCGHCVPFGFGSRPTLAG